MSSDRLFRHPRPTWSAPVGRGTLGVGFLVALLLQVVAPGGAAGQASPGDRPPEVGDVVAEVESEQAAFIVEVVATGTVQPFAMAFLPDGRLLVTDRPASSIAILDVGTGIMTPLNGLPPIYRDDSGGGVTDLVLHPDFEENGWIYFNYAHETPDGITMAVSRARLDGTSLADHEQLLVVSRPVPENTNHLGSRIAIRDGYLFLTMGERYFLRDEAQDLSNHHGTVIRLHEDGRVPADNPFVGREGARPEIWSFGHRNPQGLAFHPETGELWSHEHGPQGGDEINVIRPGRNYGWPVITYGIEYESEGGGPIGDGRTRHAGMEQPLYFYRPSIAPSDMHFYQGDAFPAWRGDLFVGAMVLTHLNRLEIVDGRVVHEERLLTELGWRVRSVEESPGGELFVGVDGGMILRLRPAEGGGQGR